MRAFTRGIAAAAGAAALGIGAAGLAQADPAPAPPPAGFGAFVLTSGNDVAGLVCSPDVGTHPDPAGACDSIRTAGGDFSALPADAHRVCPLYIRADGYPASALGLWVDADGARIVDYRHSYGNGCFADAASGGVFGF